MNATMTTNERGGFRLFKPLSAILIGGLMLGLTGCSTTRQQTRGTPEPSGFLGDYSQMQAGLPDHANLFYLKPDVNWAKYTKVWIQPIELWKSDDPDSPMGGMSSDDQQTLISLLQTSLYNSLSTNYTMVDSGGPDVLIIHAAITDAKKSKPAIGVVSSLYLPLKVISLGKQALVGTSMGVGSVSVEAELLDGATNERLCAAVDSRSGSMAVRSKFTGTWGDVEKSFDWWAARLDQRLNEWRSGTAPASSL
jgi:Protein of unknown function (DUF3313)